LAPNVILPRPRINTAIRASSPAVDVNVPFMRNYSNNVNNSPSTLAGRIMEEARNEESNNNVRYQNIRCSICLSNPTADTRLDSTICGHIFCHDCLEQALRVSRRCPTCRHNLRNRYSVHPIYTE